ncbi:Teneurin-4, partial [Ophiophagus hannah]
MELSESKPIRANDVASCKGFPTFALPLYLMGGAITSKPYSQAPLVPLPHCCQILEAPESVHNSQMVLAPSLYRTQDPCPSPTQTPGLVPVLPHCPAQAAGEPQHCRPTLIVHLMTLFCVVFFLPSVLPSVVHGWKGAECDVPTNQCVDVSCNSHGTCIMGTCICNPGYKGESCEEGNSLLRFRGVLSPQLDKFQNAGRFFDSLGMVGAGGVLARGATKRPARSSFQRYRLTQTEEQKERSWVKKPLE